MEHDGRLTRRNGSKAVRGFLALVDLVIFCPRQPQNSFGESRAPKGHKSVQHDTLSCRSLVPKRCWTGERYHRVILARGFIPARPQASEPFTFRQVLYFLQRIRWGVYHAGQIYVPSGALTRQRTFGGTSQPYVFPGSKPSSRKVLPLPESCGAWSGGTRPLTRPCGRWGRRCVSPMGVER